MALTKSELKPLYPMPVYQFRATIGETVMSFAEVSGLTIEYDMTVYKESSATNSAGPVIMRMPAQIKDVHVTLKRGLVIGTAYDLYDWLETTQGNLVEKRDITISLLDEAGEPRMTWQIRGAFPNKLDLPSFDAKSNDVAIETLSLTADKIVLQK